MDKYSISIKKEEEKWTLEMADKTNRVDLLYCMIYDIPDGVKIRMKIWFMKKIFNNNLH